MVEERFVKNVLVRVLVRDVVYACVEDENEQLFWVDERTCQLKGELPGLFDHKYTDTHIRTLETTIETLKSTIETLKSTLNANSLSWRITQEANKKLHKELEHSREQGTERDAIANLVRKHREICDEITEMALATEENTAASQKISRKLTLDTDNTHLAYTEKNMFGLARRLLHARKELDSQEVAWRAACDTLTTERDALSSELSAAQQKLVKERTPPPKEPALNPYLKNVLFQYLLSNSPKIRDQLAIVLATVLEFTPAEVAQIQQSKCSTDFFSKFFNRPRQL